MQRGRWGLVAACLFVAGAAGCGDDDGGAPEDAGTDGGPADAGPTGATARFAPSDGTPMAFLDVPFPHDLYLGADGRVALEALPIDGASTAGLDAALEMVRAQRGFCVVCSTHFAVDGPLDPTSLPRSIDASATAAIVMADVDPDSPDVGTLVPLETHYRASAGWVSVRPAPGRPLHRDRTYAVALTTQLRGADGTPLAPSEAFLTVRDGTATTDPALVRAREISAPALDALEAAGVPRATIASLAVFTTDDPTRMPLAVRAAVHSAPPPVASVDVVYPTAAMSLDDLLGAPTEPLFGEIPVTGGAMDEIAIVHTTTSKIVVGSFGAPRLPTGAMGEPGRLMRDATGAPTATGTETIPFLLVVPAGADVTSLPVVIVGHGSPRTMADGLLLADTVGSEGIAVLAYDSFLHGGRSAGAADTLLVNRRPGTDRISEADRMTVQSAIFALEGVPEGFEASMPYVEALYAQVAADFFSMVRFARSGDLTAIAAADPALAGLAFDPDAIYYLGQSFGTLITGPILTAEPDLDAAIINVPGGSFLQIAAGSARSRMLIDLAILPLYGIRSRIDEVNRKLVFEPMGDIVQWLLQGFDPNALAPYAYREPIVAGTRPDLLIQIAEWDDFVPVPGAQGMAAAFGAERIGPFDFVPSVAEATLPISGNLETPAGPVTAVAHVYPGANHGMLAWRMADVAFQPPIVPPFIPLDPPMVVTNPTDENHLEVRAFLSSRLATGQARLE